MAYTACLSAEWMKTRRSFSSWLVIIGSAFVPFIMLLANLFRPDSARSLYLKVNFWDLYWSNAWNPVATFLCPLGVILSTSLVTQLEFRNNTWKQLHTSPQSYTSIFTAKLSVLIIMFLQFLLLFNLFIYVSALIPTFVISGIKMPKGFVPAATVWKDNWDYFSACMPILAFQFLISLRFKNFLIPLAGGIGLWVASLIGISWKHNYLLPYGHSTLQFMSRKNITGIDPTKIYSSAAIYTIVFIVLAYLLYLTQKEKG